MDEIQRMQDNLLLIRRTVGWSAEEFGDKIGVTRQTINNIERGRNKLTKTQYIAMRSVLDAEIASCPDETVMLRTILDVFVDNPEKYKEEDRKKLLDSANLVTPSILAGTASRETVSKEWMRMAANLGAVAFTSAVTGGLCLGLSSAIISAPWIKKVIADTSKKDNKKNK